MDKWLPAVRRGAPVRTIVMAFRDGATMQFDYSKTPDAIDEAIAEFEHHIRVNEDSRYPGILADLYDESAWLRATSPDPSYRDGKTAVGHAKRACELGRWKDADHICTLAAAYAETSDFDKAVEFEEKAQQLSKSKRFLVKGRPLIELFKARKPYREQVPQ